MATKLLQKTIDQQGGADDGFAALVTARLETNGANFIFFGSNTAEPAPI
jgi:hypothetical protein